MASSGSNPTSGGSPRVWLAGAALLVASTALALLGVELLFRWVPAALPSGVYSMGQRFDPEVQSPVYTGRVIYNKVRRTERHANPAGFLDVEHLPDKAPGVVRVGFFGDSYVEAAQVPLEQTFFRLLAESADPERLEVLAFGISGWGTLHGLLAQRALAERFDLDASVYVFVENDPGDNAWSIQRAYPPSFLRRPFAELASTPPGFALRWAEGMQGSRLAVWLRGAYERSLLLRVVWGRLVLLRNYGLARNRESDAAMTGTAGAIPNQNDLPSSWPPQYIEETQELGRRILKAWLEEARARDELFAVLYVPRGEPQLRGEIALADTWKPWIQASSEALGIPFIDPTPELTQALSEGATVYDDHWSPAGHVAVQAALQRALLPALRR